jgi:hypothetical protein
MYPSRACGLVAFHRSFDRASLVCKVAFALQQFERVAVRHKTTMKSVVFD